MQIFQIAPPESLGIVLCELDGPNAGWTYGSIFTDRRGCRTRECDKLLAIEMEFNVSLRMAAVLAVTSRQGISLAADTPATALVRCERLPRRVRPILVTVGVVPEHVRTGWSETAMVEFWISPAAAAEASNRIFDTVAQEFSLPPWSSR